MPCPSDADQVGSEDFEGQTYSFRLKLEGIDDWTTSPVNDHVYIEEAIREHRDHADNLSKRWEKLKQ